MSITTFLNPEAILLDLEAENSDEVIKVLGTKLLELGFVKDNFIDAALEREATMPTGLPLGGDPNAAIPHVDIEYVNQSALALATLKTPVIFRNMVDSDEEIPVRLVIMLALDAPKSQIDMLQEVSSVLQQPAVIAAIMASKTADDVLAAVSDLQPI